MSKSKVLYKMKHPHKITLYRNGDNPNIYYYFTWKKKIYRGSTGTEILEISINNVQEIFFHLKKGIDPKELKKEDITFGEVSKRFIKQKKTENLSPTTIKEYERQIIKLNEKFKNKPIQSITKFDIMEYGEYRDNYYKKNPNKKNVYYKRKEKKIKGRVFENCGNTTINRECSLLVSIMRFGKEYMNLFKGEDVPSYKKRPEGIREELLTKDEYLRLKEYWMNKKPYYWMIISFVNNTGLRYPSELNELKWKDVDLKNEILIVRDRKSKSGKLTSSIPLIGNSRKIIEELKKRPNVSTKREDYIFVDDNNKRIKNIRKSFKKSLIECNINENMTMYSLRHLFTSRMIKRPDIPLKIISQTLGHKDTRMVDKHYGHLRTEDIVNIFKKSEKTKQRILNELKDEVVE